MEHLLVALAVWAIWVGIAEYLEASKLFWLLLPFALGVGGQALIDHDRLWLGLGIGGLAVFIMRVSDVLLVTADAIKAYVLKGTRR